MMLSKNLVVIPSWPHCSLNLNQTLPRSQSSSLPKIILISRATAVANHRFCRPMRAGKTRIRTPLASWSLVWSTQSNSPTHCIPDGLKGSKIDGLVYDNDCLVGDNFERRLLPFSTYTLFPRTYPLQSLTLNHVDLQQHRHLAVS